MATPTFSRAGRIVSIAACAAILALGLTTTVDASSADKKRSESFYEDAQEYLKKGDVNAATIQLKNALQKDPENVAARKALAEIYLKSGNGAAAEKEIKAAQRRDQNDPDLATMLARAYLIQGRLDDALRQIPNDVADPKLRYEALLVKAQAQLGLRQIDDAIESFTQAHSLNADDARAKVGLAQSLVSKGKPKEAEAEIDSVLEKSPDLPDVLVLKAELRRLSQDLEGALTHFNKAITVAPTNITALLGRAGTLIDLNRDDQAQTDLQSVFSRVPKHPFASYLSALSLAKKKDFTGAQDMLAQAGRVLENHLPSIYLNGVVAYSLEQYEQAARLLTRYLQVVPNNPRARKVLGATLIRRNEPARAVETLRPLLDQTPDDAQLLMLLGSAYMQTGNVADGTALYEKAAEIAPDVASIRTQLALSRLASGQADRAVNDLESAIDLEPQGGQAGILLALVKLRQGDFDGALKAATELRAKLKDNPLPENLIGAAYLGKGDVAQARQTFEAALKSRPDFHPARMNLAQIDVQEGKIDSAKAQYEAILRQSEKHIGAMMALADIAANQKRNEESVSWLQKAIDSDPKSVMPRLRLIGHYSRLGDMQRAVTVARQLDQTFPNNIRVVETLGRTEAAAGDGIASVSTFRRLTSLVPNSAPALGLLAGAQILINDVNGARESLLNAISIDRKFGPAYVALVDLELKDGRETPALRVATQLREAQPDSASGDLLSGDIYARSKKFTEAIQSYRVALRKEDTNVVAVRLFNAQRESGAVDDAFATLQKWVDTKNDRQGRHVLASAYIAAGKNDDGIRESERLLATEPENPLLLNNLAWLYQTKGNPRAQEYGEKALARAPEAPAIMDTLGWILVQKGDTARGLDLLKKATSLAPDQGDIRYHYAVAMHKSGDSDGARAELNRLLSSGSRFSYVEEARTLLRQIGG